MDPRFSKSRFSGPFNRLADLGAWPTDDPSSHTGKKLYKLKHLLGLSILTSAVAVQTIDLYFAFGDLRKMTFNLSSSVILVGYIVKIILLRLKKDDLNALRWKLWQDSLELTEKSEMAAMDIAYDKLSFIKLCFYSGVHTTFPALLISSYFSYHWGHRELPFAAYLPMQDPLNDFYFLPALFFEGVSAYYLAFIVIEGELGMFSLILQLKVYCEIFAANLKKINNIYGDEDDEFKKKKNSIVEINLYLKKERAKLFLKLSVIRHLELIECLKKFEFIFSRCLLLQLYGCSLLMVMNGLELSLYLGEISAKFGFQLMFFTGLMIDLFFLSQESSYLLHECLSVSDAAYSTVWYKMDAEIRSTLITIMICSRKPPRITAGKFVSVNLNIYLRLLRNIYSWVMLMRQFAAK